MVRVENITKRFGTIQAVRGINLNAVKGEILGILGPNGAGKTTTLRILAGVLSPSSGSVNISGEDMTANPEKGKAFIGYLPESAPLIQDMSVLDYLCYMGRLNGLDREELSERIHFLAETCGIREVMHKTTETLSRGYRQRTGLASVLLRDPPVLILDEPTSGLDPSQILEFRQLLLKLKEEKTILLSTHILSEAESLCSRILIIRDGLVAAEFLEESSLPAREKEQVLLLELEGENHQTLLEKIRKLPGIEEIEPARKRNGNSCYKIITRGERRKDIYNQIRSSNVTLLEMKQENRTLEDLYRGIVGMVHER